MSKTKTISQLKAHYENLTDRQKQIKEKIREAENANYLKIGKIVASYHSNGWSKFDLDAFKSSVSDILS